MGIPGLTSYLDSIRKLWKTIELRDTRLVVDGSCLVYFLYFNSALDCRCGGQHDEFETIITSFFAALRTEAVEPFVVLDGAYDASNKKLGTYKIRSKEAVRRAHSLAKGGQGDSSCLLPLLARLTFMQVLVKLGIRFAVCDCEADKETASLANSWGCPVLSNDSDFFIYNVCEGYIPVNSLSWESRPLTAQVYRAGKLADHFKIPQSFLPLAASLMGNDYLSHEMLAPFNHTLKRIQTSKKCSRKASRFLSIASFLSDFKTLNDAVAEVLRVFPKNKCADMQQSLNHSLEEYDVSLESNLVAYFNDGKVTSSLRSVDDFIIAGWVLQLFRKGLFPVECMSVLTSCKRFLRVQVENIGEVSAHNCSLKLRQVIYAILLVEKVNSRLTGSGKEDLAKSVHQVATDFEEERTQQCFDGIHEWDRDGKGLKQRVIKPDCELVGDFTLFPSLGNIPSLSMSQRQCFVLNVLQCKPNHSLKTLPGKFQLLIAALVLWVKTALPKVNKLYVEALLVSFLELDCTADGKPLTNQEKMCHEGSLFDLHAAHSFAQWQCVLNEAINLNLLLMEPLSTPFIPCVYSGQMVQEVLRQLKRGNSPASLVSCPDLFDALYSVVQEGVEPDAMLDSVPSQAARNGRASEDKQGQKAQRKGNAKSSKQMLSRANVSTNNRFAFLCAESSDSDSGDDNL